SLLFSSLLFSSLLFSSLLFSSPLFSFLLLSSPLVSSRLLSSRYPQATTEQGDMPEFFDASDSPDSSKEFILAKEISDPLLCNEITIQFLAYSRQVAQSGSIILRMGTVVRRLESVHQPS
ncbi:unnamed protein product, partial [Protopolystoma xenopodis]